uniref:Uncharacterized protein n=1 Tax=Rhizophora mucronata TaxID=61149 RepID=A0A2P2R0N9_RHIMU
MQVCISPLHISFSLQVSFSK